MYHSKRCGAAGRVGRREQTGARHGRRKFTVHVIGAECERNGVAAWSELFHLALGGRCSAGVFPPGGIDDLEVCLVGPRLPARGQASFERAPADGGAAGGLACGGCAGAGKELTVVYVRDAYERFFERHIAGGSPVVMGVPDPGDPRAPPAARAHLAAPPDVCVAFNCFRGETKGSKIKGKMGVKWDSRDGLDGHQRTASRCDFYL
jgi:hypothetical protein